MNWIAIGAVVLLVWISVLIAAVTYVVRARRKWRAQARDRALGQSPDWVRR